MLKNELHQAYVAERDNTSRKEFIILIENKDFHLWKKQVNLSYLHKNIS